MGATVHLDGSTSSDADGNLLTYQWTFLARPANSTATLMNPTSVTPTFTLDKAGDYTIQLLVNDGHLNSTPDTVTISTLNSAPVAEAGPDQRVPVGTIVHLTGGASSDVDGDPLTYQWAFLARPAGSSATLVDPTSVAPSFTLDQAGDYTIQLLVTDGHLASAPDTVTISTLNSPPVAEAGPDQTAHVGDTVTLDGSGSSDADSNPLTYQWGLVTKPADSTAALTNPTTPQPRLTLDKAGTYVGQLVVNDGIANSAPATVTINTLNSKPIANAGPDQSGQVGETITLDGSGSSDVDGNPLTYQWSLTTKPPAAPLRLPIPRPCCPRSSLTGRAPTACS